MLERARTFQDKILVILSVFEADTVLYLVEVCLVTPIEKSSLS